MEDINKIYSKVIDEIRAKVNPLDVSIKYNELTRSYYLWVCFGSGITLSEFYNKLEEIETILPGEYHLEVRPDRVCWVTYITPVFKPGV